MRGTPDLTRPQLFLDDRGIEETVRVQRRWFSPRKYPEPVLVAEQDWESHCPVLYGSVLRREGRFQMWYCGWTRHIPPRVCYAESDDGVRWEKPQLDLHETPGNGPNNILLTSDYEGGLIDDLTVIDDAEEGDWPLKMLYWDSGSPSGPMEEQRGIYAARSRDGICWESLGRVLPGWGDRFNAVSHRVDGRFVVLGRAPGGSPHGRAVFRTESEDLTHWSDPELVLTADAEDPPLMEIYSAMAYPHSEDLLLGTIERMHMSPDVLDPELIWSRDGGRSWMRSRTREAFIPRGERRSFDRTWVNLAASAPIRVHDRLWFYYSGRTGAHKAPYPHNHGAIGLATLRREGYCALHAAEMPGSVRTAPLTWPGGDLVVNADPRRNPASHPHNITRGEVRAEALGENGSAIEGYEADSCRPVTVNRQRSTIRWEEDRTLDALKGQRIRLRFVLRDAYLFSWAADTREK